jgi:hypothetical protein
MTWLLVFEIVPSHCRGALSASGKSGSRTYECKLELFAEVDPNDAVRLWGTRKMALHPVVRV